MHVLLFKAIFGVCKNGPQKKIALTSSSTEGQKQKQQQKQKQRSTGNKPTTSHKQHSSGSRNAKLQMSPKS